MTAHIPGSKGKQKENRRDDSASVCTRCKSCGLRVCGLTKKGMEWNLKMHIEKHEREKSL